MIPKPHSALGKTAKYFILENRDFILETDEYYNPIEDKWKPVDSDFYNCHYNLAERKPVRRKNKNFVAKGTDVYIVYDLRNYKIVKVYSSYGEELVALCKDPAYGWVNTIHPTSWTLRLINAANETTY